MSSQPRNSAPTPSTDTSSPPANSQVSTDNAAYEHEPEAYAIAEAEYLRDATGDPREDYGSVD